MSVSEAELESKKLATAFNALLNRDFGHCIAPKPYITSSGFGRHVDALIGGGFTSSLPIMFSSSPETGKSTLAFQFASSFQKVHPNSVIVYLDVENAASANDVNSQITGRVKVFGLDESKFLYKALVITLEEVFQLIEKLVEMKKALEQSKGREYQCLFIWDSLASTALSKELATENPNEVIGLRARLLTHLLARYKPIFLMNRITLVMIDQVRSNIQITSQFAPKDEKGVGIFGSNLKAASNVNSLQHNISQWLYFSKREALYPSADMGVDGWTIDIYTEKNKLAPSHYSVPVVFDKKYGAIPILSEYYFMAYMTRYEQKNLKNDPKKLIYPLTISTEGKSKVISVYDPASGNVVLKSDKFTEKNFLNKYSSDPEFKKIFEAALQLSVRERILKGYFREYAATQAAKPAQVAQPEIPDEPIAQEEMAEQFDDSYNEDNNFRVDPETGEIIRDNPEDGPVISMPEEGYVPEL
jgi:RecA/RadA recombinase